MVEITGTLDPEIAELAHVLNKLPGMYNILYDRVDAHPTSVKGLDDS